MGGSDTTRHGVSLGRQLPQPPSPPAHVGDLSILFGGADRPLPGRAAPGGWEIIWDASTWSVLTQPVSTGWRGTPIVVASHAGQRAYLLGELYGLPQPSLSASARALQTLLAGPRDGRTLNGHFLLFVWDEAERRWHVWTDRFGTLHAYYTIGANRAAIGTFFPAVAAAASRRQLDWDGLAGFLACGFFPQDRTFFEDVRIFRPASHYTFDEAGRLLQQERYWQWRHEPDPKRSYDDTVCEFAEVFAAVMAEHTREGRIAIPISGGLDSRSTVAAATNGPVSSPTEGRLWSYSYGYAPDSVETGIARQVARARALPFEAFTIRPYLFDRLDSVLACVEGFQDVIQCRQGAVVDDIARHADYVIAAHWGDVWLDDMGLGEADGDPASKCRVLDHALHKMEKRGRAWLLEHLCSPHFGGDDPEQRLRELVSEGISALGHIQDPDFRVKAFKTDQWSFRWTTTSLRALQPGAFPRLPFYDTRIADLFCTVPSTFVSGRRLQIGYLKRFAPDLARITWQVYDANLFQYQHFNSWLLPKRAVKKAWRTLTRRRIVERNWEVQLVGPAGRQGVQEWLLQPGLRLHDLVPKSEVQALLDAFYAAPLEAGRGYTVPMLLTFSAWLERYA